MILRKSKTPRKSPEKWTFLSLAFYNAPSLHTVNPISRCPYTRSKKGFRSKLFFPSGTKKNSLSIKFLGRIFLGHPGPRRRDIPDKNFMQVAFFCCLAGMSRDLGWDVPDLEKLYARKLWADFSYPIPCLPLQKRGIFQKCASAPRPPHTRQKYEQTSGRNMTPNALKQGKFGSLGAILLFIV